MPVHFNVVDLPPARTYATPDNAIKAVKKWADKVSFAGRGFNVVVLDCRKGGQGSGAEDRRYYPVLINIHTDFLHVAIHSGFNVVN
jgi:hypothetical protein